MAAPPDPIAIFRRHLQAARRGRPEEQSDAMTLSTLGKGRQPKSRVVLLRGIDDEGFVFYTNLRSAKGREIGSSDNVALCFHWPHLAIQVRIEGRAARVTAKEADAYFATRPRESQIAAWASPQSSRLANRRVLLQSYAAAKKRFGAGPVPRPPHWSGFRVAPTSIELWYGKPHRLHDRRLYTRRGNSWRVEILSP